MSLKNLLIVTFIAIALHSLFVLNLVQQSCLPTTRHCLGSSQMKPVEPEEEEEEVKIVLDSARTCDCETRQASSSPLKVLSPLFVGPVGPHSHSKDFVFVQTGGRLDQLRVFALGDTPSENFEYLHFFVNGKRMVEPINASDFPSDRNIDIVALVADEHHFSPLDVVSVQLTTSADLDDDEDLDQDEDALRMFGISIGLV
jgi:hypothetical protein